MTDPEPQAAAEPQPEPEPEPRTPGRLRGKLWMADDFDALPREFDDYKG